MSEQERCSRGQKKTPAMTQEATNLILSILSQPIIGFFLLALPPASMILLIFFV